MKTASLIIFMTLSMPTYAFNPSYAEDFRLGLQCVSERYNYCIDTVCKYSSIRDCKTKVCKAQALAGCKRDGEYPLRSKDRFYLRNYLGS